ncbi:MAG: nickel-dependent hydrogenase large subunit [Planctomycetota bacterium]|nr:nickel-dependent hydrogenase large subunit [Planctomycetota bacterium]
MATNLDINVHHLTRVEGHGNIVVRARDGKVETCQLDIVETPRVFESMIVGLNWRDTSLLTCRICGICSVGHTLASIQATDDAFGLKLTPESYAMRQLMCMAEQIQSHVLHVYFLAAPDALGVGSVIPLAGTHPEVVVRALKLKKMANHICAVLCGRHVHPISLVPGGFTYAPPKKSLIALKQYLLEHSKDIDITVDTVVSIAGKFPAFERPREDLSLTNPDEYAFYNGDLKSSKAGTIDYHKYEQFIHEKCVKHSTAKHVYNVDESLAVGALSRFNNNHSQLNARGQAAAAALGLKAPCYNPYANNFAQTVELAHCYDEALKWLDKLIAADLSEASLAPAVKPRAGRGIGLTEVPRGLLVHDYTYDAEGTCTKATCIIPTGMNLGNIDRDMQKYVPEVLAARTQEQITKDLEMLVRSYDPCISCAVHLLDVKWV